MKTFNPLPILAIGFLCFTATAQPNPTLTLSALTESESFADFSPLDYPKNDLRRYVDPEHLTFVRPGLIVDAGPEDVTIGSDGTVSIVFSVTDDKGLPLDIDGVFTPGEISVRFIFGYIPVDDDQYVSYTTRTASSSITGNTATQASTDSGGTFEKLDEGVYRYTFATKLPSDFEANATHTIGIYAERDLTEFELGENVDNELVHFVPAGGEPDIREVVNTEACNGCHNPLAFHGGTRRETGLCILCHNPGTSDPDTGNTVDFKVMVHKIHRGANLPSVEAGMPYQIIGFRNSVHDYSDVHFPQDIRNCDTCHVPAAEDSAQYFLDPTMDACGSCHDNVNFDTGENHAGGPQVSNMFCANCHFPKGELEFDTSVIGAHTIPYKSDQLEGINIEILSVANAFAGERPTVRFKLTNDAGETIQPSSLRSLTFLMAGPNEEFDFLARESATDSAMPINGSRFKYTFETPLPDLATGSYTVGAEASRNVILNEGTTGEFEFRETADPNPTFAFALTDEIAMPRRVSVTDEKCETCHENLELHGSNRHGPQYCVMCHQPAASDVAVRPPEELPPQSIHFKFMIHRIHRGEDLTRDFTVFGFRGSRHEFSHVRFPGDLRDCETCHVDDSQLVPSEGLLPTLATENEFFSPLPPDTAACLGCHDSLEAAAHASLNIAPFGEACAACHGEGKEFSVSRVHSRVE